MMSTFLHNKFLENLANKFELRHRPSVLVAVSGGQDSLCLMKLFLDVQGQFFNRIGIIHIDHQWREDTVENTSHLVNLISTIKTQSYFYQIQEGKYSEHEAREVRYQIILETANKYSYSFIATAHNSNDRLETFLQNTLRGSSPDNLNSLIWNRALTNRIRLVRPLIDIPRTEISWFCRHYYLPIWSDNTNIFYSKTRNRMRQEMIPYIKLYFQPKIEQQISNFLDKINSDSDYLKQNTIKLYLQIKHPYLVAINYHKLLKQHRSIQERVVQIFLEHNTHLHCENTVISRIIEFLDRKLNNNILYENFQIKVNKNWIYLCHI
jgi:tRNA(Ile)-lysidine synthase|uniref:tRNA(Ile)-lysidine synthase, chloroplastic n=1 Tax=Palmaria decipiens TaxID=187399 RepID=A0A6C0W2E4_PALDE|nr:tRNA(Ile)-lysidine synthase [Palmaria decipiens]QIC19633.1 tRNA(Ile)-lysidine synthase [Palmaria decipiens]